VARSLRTGSIDDSVAPVHSGCTLREGRFLIAEAIECSDHIKVRSRQRRPGVLPKTVQEPPLPRPEGDAGSNEIVAKFHHEHANRTGDRSPRLAVDDGVAGVGADCRTNCQKPPNEDRGGAAPARSCVPYWNLPKISAKRTPFFASSLYAGTRQGTTNNRIHVLGRFGIADV